MAYDPGALDAALAAAVGDDPTLVAELRVAFLASAEGHARALARAANREEWQAAAWRLQGLAASFGVPALMELAHKAAASAVGDPAILRRIGRALAAFGG